MLRLLPTDPPTPLTDREIAGLNLPVFDGGTDIGRTSAVDQMSEMALKEKPNPVGAATPFILGEGLLPTQRSSLEKFRKASSWIWPSYCVTTMKLSGGGARRMVRAPQMYKLHRVGEKCPIY